MLRLKVQGPDGHVQYLEFADATEAVAMRRVASRGFRVLAVDSGFGNRSGSKSVRTGNSARFPLLLFSQELLALLEAGLNLTEAMGTLHAKERQESSRIVLDEVLLALREGRSLSDVLATLPQHFPEVYVATVRASERTGNLPQSLQRYIAYQLQFEEIRKKLISAAIYPVMLVVVGGFVTLFLLGYVVPRFAVVYESAGRELPWLSAALLTFGKFIHANWPWALGCFLGALLLLVTLIARPQGRAWLQGQVLRLPSLSAKASEFRMARFYRAVSLLLSAGIPLPRAMGMVMGLLTNVQQRKLAQCRIAIEQGVSLSGALVAVGLASPVAESLIRVGERSGQMADMLERTARFADEDFGRWVDWASRLIEPILMLVIGIVIGLVVVLMYMPIFELAGSLQ